eukprot:9357091-Pyramimonas_sp.AAC.1
MRQREHASTGACVNGGMRQREHAPTGGACVSEPCAGSCGRGANVDGCAPNTDENLTLNTTPCVW